MKLDITSIMIIVIDIFVSGFLIWRATCKKATLWGTARFIYMYIATMVLYHGSIYLIGMFVSVPEAEFVHTYLHPVVVLYMINPVLIALIHWRGGRLP
jgi:hypothetical protein